MLDLGLLDMGALAVAFFWGTVLSGIYFGALWLTLQRLARQRHPALHLMVSLLLRQALLLAGFYWILAGGHWDRLLLALIGFVTVRTLLMRIREPAARTPSAQSHAGMPS